MVRSLIVAVGCLVLAACGAEDDAVSTKDVEAAAVNAVAAASEDAASTDTASTGTATPSDEAGERTGTWGDIIYGDPNAPVEVIEYASLTCPHCADFAVNYFPAIKEKYVDTGKVKFVYRNFIFNRQDLAASTIARCSNPEVTRTLMKTLFARQHEWARSQNIIDDLASIARQAGISRVQFDRCLANRDMHAHLVEMTKKGSEDYQVNSTPSFFIDGKSVENWTRDLDDKLAEATE